MKKTISLLLALMLVLSSAAAFAEVQEKENSKTIIRYKVEGSYEWSIPVDFTMRYVFDEGDIPLEDTLFDMEKTTDPAEQIGNWPDPADKPTGEKTTYPDGMTWGDLCVWDIKVGTKKIDIYMQSENGYSLKYTDDKLDPQPANIGYDLYFGEVGSETKVDLKTTTKIKFNKKDVEGVVYLMSLKTGADMEEEVLTPVVRSFRYRNTTPYPEKLGTYQDKVTFYAILNKADPS